MPRGEGPARSGVLFSHCPPSAGARALRPDHPRGQWARLAASVPRQVKGECLPDPCPEVRIFSLQLLVSLGAIQQPMPFTLGWLI